MAIERDITTQQQPKSTKTTHQSTTNTVEDSIPNPSLPHEIIVDILSRLPVKSLLQCRCVSKSWRSFISGPQFVKFHLDMSTKHNEYARHRLILRPTPYIRLKNCSIYSVLYEHSAAAVDLDYPFKNYYSSVWIVGSCNGLLCLANEENAVCAWNPSSLAVFLWNPSTRQSRRLPGINLRFGCYVICGFGYVESTDDYKVVGLFCVFRDGVFYDIEVKVYTMRTDTWRRIQDFPRGIPFADSGKFANGALHWVAGHKIGSGSSYSRTIISLDLAGETYGEVLQPTYGEGAFDLTLWVLEECLCVLCNYRWAHVDIWMMKEYGVRESWTKLFTIPYLTDTGMYQVQDFTPLCIAKNGEILLQLGSYLVLYNSKDNTFRYPEIHNTIPILKVDTYVESLVSPNVDNGA